MVLYLVHGLLHLAGYDDLTAEERGEMEELQESLVEEVYGRGRGFSQG